MAAPGKSIFLGLDFGTESVRALLVDSTGRELGSSVSKYPHGQITLQLPDAVESKSNLPAEFALQHPSDWLQCAGKAVRAAVRQNNIGKESIAGIGVDFTSCTVLPTKLDTTPLCLLEEFAKDPMAWPKLWKHHGAHRQAERILQVAIERKESFLKRYGGSVSLEWLFPKLLETLETSPKVYRAADLFIEAGDWIVWKLTGGSPNAIPRSTCQAGYKGFWNAEHGWPAPDFFAAIDSRWADIVSTKLRGDLLSPGVSAGTLDKSSAKLLGLCEGTVVSSAIIDAHAGVPGAGAAQPGTLVMVMGTSACHMVNSELEHCIPGVAGVVRDGILPGFFGYETGQAAVGDAFDWLKRLTGHKTFEELNANAMVLPPGSEGVRCVDWMNGCRTPLLDGALRGSFSGLNLQHQPAHLYRALIEATGFGVRWIADELRSGGIALERFIATGGLPHHNPGMMQIYADILGQTILVHPCKYGPALGAAILAAIAAGHFSTPESAIGAMAVPKKGTALTYRPNSKHVAAYDRLYSRYRADCEWVRASQTTEQV